MSVYKMIEVVGTSETSIDDAIHGAIQRASESVDDLQWFEVKEIRGRVLTGARTQGTSSARTGRAGKNAEFQVKIEIGFLVHAPKSAGRPRGEEKAMVARRGGRKGAAKSTPRQRSGAR